MSYQEAGDELPASVTAVSSGKGKYYLTNQDLLPAVIDAKAKGIITDKLAKMLMLLTDRYSRRSNFIGYSFRSDMVSSALVNLCQNALKFDPERSNNPFAFYTTAIHNSFLQYMSDEKKHRFIRDSLLVDQGSDPSHSFTGYLNERDRPDDDSGDSGSDYAPVTTMSAEHIADEFPAYPNADTDAPTPVAAHKAAVAEIKAGTLKKENIVSEPVKTKRQSADSLVKF